MEWDGFQRGCLCLKKVGLQGILFKTIPRGGAGA